MFHQGDCVGIVASSNGLKKEQEKEVEQLKSRLFHMGLVPVLSLHIYQRCSIFSGNAKERAEDLMQFFKEKKIRAIFDISGGDVANELLEYLDYKTIRESEKFFFGYSDLTVLLNGIYQKTGLCTYLYQVRNLVKDQENGQKKRFMETFFEGGSSLYETSWKFIQGERIEGIAVGGNIRCFLKLAGTPYFPDVTDKVLFLESFGGEEGVMTAFFTQLRQMGVFEKIQGILLGTFTKMQQEKRAISIETLVQKIVDHPSLPIAKTEQIGHGTDARCFIIGSWLQIQKKTT